AARATLAAHRDTRLATLAPVAAARSVRDRRIGTLLPSVLPFLDHTSEVFASDPHGTLRAAREGSWIVETPTGLGVLTYAACNAVIADPRFRPGVFELMRRAGSGGAPVDAGRTLLGSEGVDHQQLRHVVAPSFTPRRINTLRVQTADLAHTLVRDVSAAGTSEFMADVARRIPPTVFCWMVGC